MLILILLQEVKEEYEVKEEVKEHYEVKEEFDDVTPELIKFEVKEEFQGHGFTGSIPAGQTYMIQIIGIPIVFCSSVDLANKNVIPP